MGHDGTTFPGLDERETAELRGALDVLEGLIREAGISSVTIRCVPGALPSVVLLRTHLGPGTVVYGDTLGGAVLAAVQAVHAGPR